MSKDEYKGDARDLRLSGPQTKAHKDLEFVRGQMMKDALEQCHETRAAYVECARGVFH